MKKSPSPNPTPQPPSPSQVERFKQAARELGASEDEAAFEETIRKVAEAAAGTNKPKRDSR